jgi:hypothetical protein
MIRLEKAVKAWGTNEFSNILKQEIENMDPDYLPLQQGLTTSSHALHNNIQAMILGCSDDNEFIYVKTGIFYSGVIGGCNCADDPTPMNENNEYCVVQVTINKDSFETTIQILNT